MIYNMLNGFWFLAFFKKILWVGFRAILNFQKFKVALNLTYRIFLNFAKKLNLIMRTKSW